MSYKNNAISSDDPKAIEKLTEKLQKCEELQTLMKKANAHYKKYGTVKGCEGISDEKAENLDMSARSVHYHWEKQPFPSYHITNSVFLLASRFSIRFLIRRISAPLFVM